MKKIALFHLENFQTKVFWKFLSTTFLLNLFQFQGMKKQILQNPPESELPGYLGHATTLFASAVWII